MPGGRGHLEPGPPPPHVPPRLHRQTHKLQPPRHDRRLLPWHDKPSLEDQHARIDVSTMSPNGCKGCLRSIHPRRGGSYPTPNNPITFFTISAPVSPHIASTSSGVLALLGIRATCICLS